jgi:hypothetical protein
MRKNNIKLKKLNKTEIVLSIIIMFFPLLLLKTKFQDLNIDKTGIIVPMKIVQKPYSCLGTKAKWFMKVEYQGKVYIKQIGGQFCEEHNLGDIVEMKYLENSTTVLFHHESVMSEIYAIFLLSFIGLSSLIYYSLIKKSL